MVAAEKRVRGLRVQLRKYWTVLVPWVPTGRTEWHCNETDPTSRWYKATLSRGAFNSPELARKWAREHLNGARFALKSFPRL